MARQLPHARNEADGRRVGDRNRTGDLKPRCLTYLSGRVIPMKTYHDWALGSESWDEQRDAGRYNPASQVRIDGGPVLTIGAGGGDTVDVFQEHGLYFVVSVNHGLEYCGLEVFDKDGDQLAEGNVFLQADHEVSEALGPRGVDLTPMVIAKRLSVYAGM